MTNYPEEIFTLFDDLIEYAHTDSDLRAVLLVGSYATGGFSIVSDINLVLLSKSPHKYLNSKDWYQYFGIVVDSSIKKNKTSQLLRVKYSDKEVEFKITSLDWAQINPIDSATFSAIKKGAKIIYDPDNLLKNLLEKMY